MCGIIGYVGNKLAVPVLIDSLNYLSYRGYDSAGISFIEDETIKTIKKQGKVNVLAKEVENKLYLTNIGIGHTRWATHGKPSDYNSHPHESFDGEFSIVHNGIIENYEELMEFILDKGIEISSETDSEIIAHLISLESGDLLERIPKVLKKLKGSYALLILDKKSEDKIYFAKLQNPLIVANGENENFISSDYLAFINYTNKIHDLSDGDYGFISKDEIKIFDKDNETVNLEWKIVSATLICNDLDNYTHYMEKEIYYIPNALKNTLTEYQLSSNALNQISDDIFKNCRCIHIVACGTALNAGLILKYLIEENLGLFVNSYFASEFRYNNIKITKADICIFISQSGETADTIEALKKAKQSGAITISITNNNTSTIFNLADYSLQTYAGQEIAVASTKAYNAQLLVCYIIYNKLLELFKDKIFLNDKLNEINELIPKVTSFMEKLNVDKLANLVKTKSDVYFIGRGQDYFTAIEGALKLKEITYIHAESLSAGELKHGTLSLITEDSIVIAFATQNKLLDKLLNTLFEVKTRGAFVVLITPFNVKNKVIDELILIPTVEEEYETMFSIIPIQLLSYKTAVCKKLNPDKPRNLAKSVTVE